MRRSTISVFVLLLVPSTAGACFDEHKSGWFTEMPARSWERLAASREGSQGEEMFGLWGIAAGIASLALLAVSFRVYVRAGSRERMHPLEPAERPLAPPSDGSGDWTLRVDPAHPPGMPARVAPQAAARLDAVAAVAD